MSMRTNPEMGNGAAVIIAPGRAMRFLNVPAWNERLQMAGRRYDLCVRTQNNSGTSIQIPT